MSIWWVLLALWLIVQVPFVVAMYRWKPLASRYPTSVTSRLLIPWSKGWESRVQVDDVPEMRRYRRFLLLYYYGVFLAPILALFVAMAASAESSIAYLPKP